MATKEEKTVKVGDVWESNGISKMRVKIVKIDDRGTPVAFWSGIDPRETWLYGVCSVANFHRNHTLVERDGKKVERIAPQPAPRDTGSRPTWELVIEDIERWYSPAPLLIADMRDRDAQGRAKYGVPLTSDNGRDHLLDAYQELLDGAAYLRAEIENKGMPIGHIYRDVLQCLLHVREVIALRDFEGNLADIGGDS